MDSKEKKLILHIDSNLTIELTRKRMKSIRMRLASDGTVKVSAPYGVPQAVVEGFVLAHRDWIERARRRSEASKPDPPCDGGRIMVWGVPYTIRMVDSGKRSKAAYIEGFELVVPLSAAKANAEGLEAACQAFLAAEVKRALEGGIVDSLEARIGVHASGWRVRSMTSRWGSCQVVKRMITINSRLAHHPAHCLEYVVCHELCHLIEPSHNARFHALMDRFYPGWKAVRKELRG